MRVYRFPVVIEKDEDGVYIGTVPSLKGCHTQAKDIATLEKRLREAILLCLEVKGRKKGQTLPQNEFVGVHQLEIVRQ